MLRCRTGLPSWELHRREKIFSAPIDFAHPIVYVCPGVRPYRCFQPNASAQAGVIALDSLAYDSNQQFIPDFSQEITAYPPVHTIAQLRTPSRDIRSGWRASCLLDGLG